MMQRSPARPDRRLLLTSMLASFAFLLICSKSSFLYPMNDWVDVHCFFTMGRSIWDGLVPYRDLYEQKGPVLYFVYALAALISSHSFLGVFLIEVICFGMFLYFSGRIAQLYLANQALIYGVVIVLAAVIPVSTAFAHGSGVEELSLFMLAYSLFSVLSALKNDRPLTFQEAFLNGLFAAAVLLSKFTILGFYIGLALFVIIWYVSKGYRLTALLSTVGQFLLGVCALSLPVLIYFLINHAVDDLFTVYFYNNLFLYPTTPENSRIYTIAKLLLNTLKQNFIYSVFILFGFFYLFLESPNSWRILFMNVLTFGGLAFGTYWGGRGYPYYGLIFSVFTVYGLIGIVRVMRHFPIRRLLISIYRRIPFSGVVTAALSVAFLVSFCYRFSQNTYLMHYEKADMPAYRFAATIQQTYNAKILNYGFLDGGFYYAADTKPVCEFFCTLNIDAPNMWQQQRECIEKGSVDFVITRYYTLDRYSANSTNYTLVDQVTFPFEGIDFTYYLYQKNTGK